MKTIILTTLLSLMLVFASPVCQAQSAMLDEQTTQQTQQQETVKPTKNKIFGFLKDINAINIVLIAFGTFAGGLWFKGRTKLKQLADIFQKAYEYTDDKKLSDEERSDLINRFFEIIGKKAG